MFVLIVLLNKYAPRKVHKIQLAVTNDFFTVHVAFFDHNFHRENAVASRGIFVHKCFSGLSLLDSYHWCMERILNHNCSYDRDKIQR